MAQQFPQQHDIVAQMKVKKEEQKKAVALAARQQLGQIMRNMPFPTASLPEGVNLSNVKMYAKDSLELETDISLNVEYQLYRSTVNKVLRMDWETLTVDEMEVCIQAISKRLPKELDKQLSQSYLDIKDSMFKLNMYIFSIKTSVLNELEEEMKKQNV